MLTRNMLRRAGAEEVVTVMVLRVSTAQTLAFVGATMYTVRWVPSFTSVKDDPASGQLSLWLTLAVTLTVNPLDGQLSALPL